MSSLKQVIAILDSAEAELREIVKDALGRGDYSDVAAVTTLAKAVAELRRSVSGSPTSSYGESFFVSNATTRSGSANEASSPGEELTRNSSVRSKDLEKSGYPRFERHAKKLVKLGWSSKDRRVYEHRTPFAAVEEICRHFAERAGSKKLLKIEKLLPMKTDEGEEIPSYQVYLVLKWLQQHGVVERQGKDGYVVAQSDFDLKSLWDKTPTR